MKKKTQSMIMVLMNLEMITLSLSALEITSLIIAMTSTSRM